MIEGDENKATPSPHFCFRQTKLFGLQLREIPGERVVPERAIGIPFPSVEGTPKPLLAACMGLQLATAMEANILQRLDLIWGGPDDQQRAADNLVDEIIADLGNLFFPTGHLPAL